MKPAARMSDEEWEVRESVRFLHDSGRSTIADQIGALLFALTR